MDSHWRHQFLCSLIFFQSSWFTTKSWSCITGSFPQNIKFFINFKFQRAISIANYGTFQDQNELHSSNFMLSKSFENDLLPQNYKLELNRALPRYFFASKSILLNIYFFLFINLQSLLAHHQAIPLSGFCRYRSHIFIRMYHIILKQRNPETKEMMGIISPCYVIPALAWSTASHYVNSYHSSASN